MLKYQPYVLAIDLEGTLISNAVSQFSRSGLYNFLEYCHNNFCRIVIFTAVSELHFRNIAITFILKMMASSIESCGNYRKLVERQFFYSVPFLGCKNNRPMPIEYWFRLWLIRYCRLLFIKTINS